MVNFLPGCYKQDKGQGHFAPARESKMPRTVLVTDDNPFIRKMLCQIFEGEADYDICAEATNGQEAIDLARKHRPELIILDLSMPVLNGLEAARELKRIMPTVPIILFTQYADLGNTLSRDGLLIDRVVPKGDVRGLMEQIRSLIPV
jgi:CheY-like chemotaxis protein